MTEKEKGIYILDLSVELDEDDIRTLERYGKVRSNNSEPSERNLKGYCEILLGGAIENLSKKYYEEDLEEHETKEIKEMREMQKGLRKAATKLEKVIEGLKEENEEKAEAAMAEYILQLIKVQSI